MKDYREMSESVLERRDMYRTRRRRRMKGIMSGAVCFCAAALLGAGIWAQGAGGGDGSRGEKLGDAQGEQKESRLAAVEDSAQQSQSTVADRPAAENPGSTGTLEAYEAVWGGSYTDEAGRLVILLTEDTAENREKVFQLNPALTERNTIFETADYSLRYLTDLMEKISQAMVQKEFPNVTSAALREDRNRILVTMLDQDVESEARLQALDTMGGAIEIEYSSGTQQRIMNSLEELSEPSGR